MTDNRTTELREKLDKLGIKHLDSDLPYNKQTRWNRGAGGWGACYVEITHGSILPADSIIDNCTLRIYDCTPEQAIAATLGRPKAKAHPYGYEPDTGAFDCTRCECGCINDISATYCNDCGGEIEIDMYAEKEIYHTPRHLVFAEKHDDGSLEFGGKRYVAAKLGNHEIVRCRDCVYFDKYENDEISVCYRFDNEQPIVEPDGFCAWGERRES